MSILAYSSSLHNYIKILSLVGVTLRSTTLQLFDNWSTEEKICLKVLLPQFILSEFCQEEFHRCEWLTYKWIAIFYNPECLAFMRAD